ncbi:MAG TPA: hypothetical protein VES95_08030 [Dermatophilaceae bacterium]|nr:hypothetical protein [Dermatophilaceae bacterium]
MRGSGSGSGAGGPGPAVVVDGSGALPAEVAAMLRRVTPHPVIAGPGVADAAEAALAAGQGSLPRLVAIVRPRAPETHETAVWHRLGTPHLLVTCGPKEATVGPLVLPGATSCTRCHDLVRTELDPAYRALAGLRLAVGPARWEATDPGLAVLTAAVAAVVVADAADGGSTLGGVSTDLLAGPPNLAHRFWPRHPRCGCAARPGLVPPPTNRPGTMAG